MDRFCFHRAVHSAEAFRIAPGSVWQQDHRLLECPVCGATVEVRV